MNLERLMAYMDVGGAFVIWALLACSVVVVAVCFERLYLLIRSNVDGEWLLKQLSLFVSHDRFQDAIDFCDNRSWHLAKVLQNGLYRSHCNREEILQGMDVAISASSRSLEANLSILGTIAVIAPFIGLFGTVLGIIQAFNDIARHGKTGIETVGAGVAEALVTTAAGLFVAILAVIAFNAFKSKIKRMTGEIVDTASRFGEVLYFKQTGVRLPADLGIEISPPTQKKGEAKGTER